MNRRAFLCGSVATALALPLAAGAQPPAKAARIGVLCGVTFREAFAQGLRELGYADHRSFVIESRDVAVVDLPRAANDLVRQPVDVVVACTTPEALAAKRATSSIPIVAITEDPVGSGLAASLARPGGNVTGLSLLSSEVGAKRLELLKEAVPRASRIAVFWSFYLPQPAPAEVKGMQQASPALGTELIILGARLPNEHADVLAAAVRAHAEAVIVTTDTVGSPYDVRLKEILAHYQLPAMFHRREDAQAGGLISFGVSIPAVARRAATYVDKILKGAKPGDLPIEQPTNFELVINLKTARALGLTIPPSLLLRADKVIE